MKKVNSNGRSTKVRLADDVDFADLFDGDTWQLTKGEDFECSPSSAATIVRNEFRARYGHLRVRETKDGIEVTATRGEMWRKQ